MEYRVKVTEYFAQYYKNEHMRSGVVDSPWPKPQFTAMHIIKALKVREGASVTFSGVEYDPRFKSMFNVTRGFTVKDGKPYDVCVIEKEEA